MTDNTASVGSAAVPAALIAFTCAAEIGLFLGPFIVGGVVERYAVSDGTGGVVYSIEVGAAAVTAALAAALAQRIRARPVIVAAMLLLFASNSLSVLAAQLEILIVCRALAGLSAGTLMALGNALIAQCPSPHRTYSRLQFVLISGVLCAFLAVPYAVALFEFAGVFVVMAAINLAALPFIVTDLSTTRPITDTGVAKPFLSRKVLLMLVAVVSLFAAQNGLWAYVERIGNGLDLDLQVISSILMLTTAVALAGPALAHWIGNRLRLAAVINVAIVIQLAAALVLVTSASVFAYASGAVIYSTAFMFVIPYLKTALVVMDPSGRAVGSMVAVGMFGTSAGPALLGLVLDATGNYASLAGVAGAGFMLSILLATLSVSRNGKVQGVGI